MKMSEEIRRLVRAETVVVRSDHPRLAGALDWMVASGQLCAVLPGVYAAASQTADLRVRALAVTRLHRDCVITHHAAAHLSYWPEAPLRPPITVASTVKRPPHQGFRFQRRTIAAELVQVRGGIRMTVPALTALDLSTLEQSEPLDTALRRRVVTMDQLEEVLRLTRGRRGNAERRRLVDESGRNPWSYGERCAHRVLDRFGIVGWVANLPFRLPSGRLCLLDIAFTEQMIAVEIDGRTHRLPGALESDLERQNALHQAGWIVLRFTPAQLAADPEHFIQVVQQMLQLRRGQRGA